MDRLAKIIEERKKRAAGNHVYQDRSRERLSEIVRGKCNTIMIGALDQFEKKFGKLWNHGNNNKDETQREFLKLWKECRKDILDKGNAKIRDLEKELDEYSITWVKKTYRVETEDKIDEFYRRENS